MGAATREPMRLHAEAMECDAGLRLNFILLSHDLGKRLGAAGVDREVRGGWR